MTRFVAFVAAALLAVPAAADPAAWLVEGASGNRVILLGSVHYLRDSDYPLPANIDAHYAAADRLVMEIDIDDLDPLQIQAAFLQAAMLPGGQELVDVLRPEVHARAVETAASVNADLALLASFEPWLVAITLLDVGMGRAGFRSDRGIEQYLAARAARDGKEISGLETLGDQIRVFDGLEFAHQEALLEQTLSEIENPSDELEQMIAAWRSGNLDMLGANLMREFDDFPALYDALVVDRNARWIDTLTELLNGEDDVLVVVGALHLIGPDSVVQMLRRRGYRVDAL